ncbi:uncharacterized protein LOC110732605 isoform X1 [Chenopodium quinoa]|uniref:uncharacterized protein LOC110732605 isoform X1 n=1 Tax=Chenopodium quinoa TaxID=63459 RepID=UPI000B7930A0|nr:uncharacterized protein LOC110732605 isoform X1 [Chenopodium quinoa]
MLRYCLGLSLDFQTTRFEFNAVKLREMDTPQQIGMVHDDVIVAYPVLGGLGYRDVHNVTLCIRMHKERDMFVRVRRYTAILPQLIPCFPNIGPREQGYLHFVYGGLQLDGNHVADALNMEDGDIIDGFNFITMSSSLSTIGSSLTLIVKCVSGNETRFTVTQSTRLGQMMDRLRPYDSNSGRRDIHFVFGGRRLEDTETVKEAHLKDGDVIDSLRCMYVC